MRKKFSVLLCICALFCTAQKTKPYTEVSNAVSFNPFALAEIDFTALAGYEQKVKERLFVTCEAGYIFASAYITDQSETNNSKASGFLIRPALKYFVNSNNKFYVQPQIFYKQVTHSLYDWLGKDVVAGVPSYEELQHFKYRRKIFGANAIVGFALPLDKHRKGYIDFYMGLGLRRKINTVLNEPNSLYQRRSMRPLDGGPGSEGTLPSVPLGIRFIYAIR